jgi:hypothetical protein
MCGTSDAAMVAADPDRRGVSDRGLKAARQDELLLEGLRR